MTEQDDRKRLQERYAALSDEELCAISEDAVDLTESARELLQQEMATRNLPSHPRPAAQDLTSTETRPVVIAKFLSMHEASIAKGQLESAGIPCFLFDENLIRLHWLASLSVGGVRLAVHQENEEEAREILCAPIPKKFEVDGVGEFQQIRCPQCQSLRVSVEQLRRLHIDEKGAPAAPGEEAWHCHDCGALWQVSEDDNSVAPSDSL